MNKDRPKYLHVQVFLKSQEEGPEEFFRVTEIQENAEYDLLEIVRDRKVVGFFDKKDVSHMEVRADA